MHADILAQLQQAESEAQKTWIITNTILETLPTDLSEAVIAAAVPHWFNIRVLVEILGIEAAQSERVLEQLQLLSFSEPFGDLGWTLHDMTRMGILTHLVADRLGYFLECSRRAFNHFSRFDGAQNVVEAIYHLLVIEKEVGLKKFKEQMEAYSHEPNFSAANNLLRCARELFKTGTSDPER